MFNQHFYHGLTRKYVIAFGTMFNNINIVRYDNDTGEERERVRVPILYGQKEKYVTRLMSDPNLNREIQTILPRMSYEITGVNYDAQRKQNSLLRQARGNTATRVASMYMGVPYDIHFDLNIYARNIDDGTHIVEQILPYFNPDYNVSMNPIPEIGFLKDIPMVLNNVVNQVEYEGSNDAVRYVNWTLSFTMKAHYYGPVSTPKIIRKVNVNIYNDPSLQAGYIVRVNLNQGNNGTFQIEDTVFQGTDITTANAYGIVVNWYHDEAKLFMGAAQGQFKVGQRIRAASSNASYVIQSFDASPLKLASINVTPVPIDAQPTDDYGYDTEIIEYMVPTHANT